MSHWHHDLCACSDDNALQPECQCKALVKEDSAAYFRAMVHNNHSLAVEIERRYDLYGYPPELVSIGLQGAMEGLDPVLTVDRHVAGASDAE